MAADLCQGVDYLARNAATIGPISAEIIERDHQRAHARVLMTWIITRYYINVAQFKAFRPSLDVPECGGISPDSVAHRHVRGRFDAYIISGPITCEKHSILTRLCKHLKYLGVRVYWRPKILVFKYPGGQTPRCLNKPPKLAVSPRVRTSRMDYLFRHGREAAWA